MYTVKTRIPYHNYVRTFATFDETQSYLLNTVGLNITDAPCDGSTQTYHLINGQVYVTGGKAGV
jgi:hypothetical protein